MPEPKPLSDDEIDWLQRLCAAVMDRETIHADRNAAIYLILPMLPRLLATIRRRDELIRWYNRRFPVGFIADYQPESNYITGWTPNATDIQNAKEIVEIVEAGDE